MNGSPAGPGAPARRRAGGRLRAAAIEAPFPGFAPRGLAAPWFTLSALALLALPVLGCGAGPEALRLPAGTPVVLISIDTLRADRLPAYGYRGVETPALDALSREAILFENAYTHVPLTLPAHASLLTGLLPGAHGVRDNVGYVLPESRVASGEVPYLPRLLGAHGYATGGAVSAFVLRAKTGLAQGFDRYEDGIEFRPGVGLGGLQRPGTETLRLIRPWLSEVAGGPFFLFFHLYEPHTPYQPPEPFASRYPSPYDGEIAAADRVVGELIAELERLGVYEDALVLLLSDHGEGLGDHGEDEHGVLLYREAIRVPLLLKLPGGRMGGRTVEAPAQLVDVLPTVGHLLGLPLPPGLPGRPLTDLLAPEPPARRVYSETFYPRLHFGWSELASLAGERFHYIEGPRPELYDLAADPGERANAIDRERRAFAELRRELAGYDRALAAPGEVDPETRAALAALGYVGSAAALETEGPLPDPREQLPTLTALKEGFAHQGRREWAEAAATFRRVLAANPRMVDAWESLGRALERMGETEEALSAYRKALEYSGGSPHVALAAASLYFDLGRLAEAEEHARLALPTHPSFAHGLLAQIALGEQDLARAEREAREALAAEEGRVGPLVTLAAVVHAKGSYEEALELTGRAMAAYEQREARDSDLIRGLHLVRGKALADLGRVAEAEAAFQREIELFPEDPKAYSNLAVLLGLTGRGAEVGPLLHTMVEARPGAAAYAEAVRTLRILEDGRAASSLLAYALRLYPESEALRGLRGAP